MCSSKRLKILVIISIAFVFLANAQVDINKPNLGGFSKACAGDSFNNYNISFAFTPESALEASNQFIIELSDANGDFSSPTIVFTSNAGSITTSPGVLGFAIPIETSGEDYRVRVRSTAPAAISTPSNAFPAYYKLHDSPFTINNLEETAEFCVGGSYLLTIDNPAVPPATTPLIHPSLTYNWYREINATTSVLVETGNTYSVREAGTYFAETNYGSCSSNSFSNKVTIVQGSSGGSGAITINSSLGNPFCSGDGVTTLSTIEGADNYEWLVDGNVIDGATSSTYQTNESGFFQVVVTVGDDCESDGSILLENNDFDAAIDVPEFPEINKLEPEENLLVTVTTSATNPEFKWYIDDSEISGENGNTYEATKTGNYRVEVIQSEGCQSFDELFFEVEKRVELFPNVEKIPNVVTPNDDGENDTWIIPLDYISGTNAKITIISQQGEIVFETNDYQNNWPDNELDFKAVSPVFYYVITTQNQETKKGSITVIR